MPPLTAFKRMDVRPLIAAGEEPFPKILARIESLATDEGLIVVAPFLPSPLIERFSSKGFCTKVEPGTGGQWMVYFWRE